MPSSFNDIRSSPANHVPRIPNNELIRTLSRLPWSFTNNLTFLRVTSLWVNAYDTYDIEVEEGEGYGEEQQRKRPQRAEAVILCG
ncbi:hypothetical protein SAMN05428962_0483 [Paenibacillus sp. BC26]|nr:hypothetical protein SAMN05428962_0483 [Paenibacillus sp. BC26]